MSYGIGWIKTPAVIHVMRQLSDGHVYLVYKKYICFHESHVVPNMTLRELVMKGEFVESCTKTLQEVVTKGSL